jgi:hypothetical protein
MTPPDKYLPFHNQKNCILFVELIKGIGKERFVAEKPPVEIGR